MNTALRPHAARRPAQPVSTTPRRGVALTGGLCVALMACAALVQVRGRVTELPATASWAEERRFADLALEMPAGHRDTGFEERGAALVTDGDRKYVLSASGALEPVAAGGPDAAWTTLQVTANARSLVARADRSVHLARGAQAPAALALPAGFVAEGKVSGVRLTQDGRGLAWAGSVRVGRTERSALVVTVPGEAARVVGLANADALVQAELVSVDTQRERVELADAAGSCLTLDFDGQILAQSVREAGGTVRAAQVGAAGRAVWTTGRGATLEWSTGRGSGAMTLGSGLSIASVSISPDGKRIAYTTQAARASSSEPAVVVVDAATGNEQLRRYAGRATVRAAFVGASRLAVSVADSFHKNLVVLRVPGA